MLLSCADVDAAEERIRSANVVVTQLEIEPSVTLHALKLARKHGGTSTANKCKNFIMCLPSFKLVFYLVRTVLNPAPAQELSAEFYENCDVFCPNETEVWLL